VLTLDPVNKCVNMRLPGNQIFIQTMTVSQCRQHLLRLGADADAEIPIQGSSVISFGLGYRPVAGPSGRGKGIAG
jgi:hypothetical protein